MATTGAPNGNTGRPRYTAYTPEPSSKKWLWIALGTGAAVYFYRSRSEKKKQKLDTAPVDTAPAAPKSSPASSAVVSNPTPAVAAEPTPKSVQEETPKAEPKEVPPYDFVADVDDVRCRQWQGWSVEIHSDAADKPGVVVAVLGVYNRGKTFLLNHIAEEELPASLLMHTRGLRYNSLLLYRVVSGCHCFQVLRGVSCCFYSFDSFFCVASSDRTISRRAISFCVTRPVWRAPLQVRSALLLLSFVFSVS